MWFMPPNLEKYRYSFFFFQVKQHLGAATVIQTVNFCSHAKMIFPLEKERQFPFSFIIE